MIPSWADDPLVGLRIRCEALPRKHLIHVTRRRAPHSFKANAAVGRKQGLQSCHKFLKVERPLRSGVGDL